MFLIKGKLTKKIDLDTENNIKYFISNVIKFDKNIIEHKKYFRIKLTIDKISEKFFY